MLRSRIATPLTAALAVVALGVAFAAPPKPAGSKKKSADGDSAAAADAKDDDASTKKVVKTDAEWKKILTGMQFRVARKKDTELPNGAPYHKFKKEGEGTYKCVCCGQTLFESKTKFDSGTGWPSFFQPIDEKAIERIEDATDGMIRVEVTCSRCDGHLGHVFPDGPKPTGERFCMNYASLKFVPAKGAAKGAADKGTKGKTAKAKGAKAKDKDMDSDEE